MNDTGDPHNVWSACHASMGQCHATLLDVCASTADPSVRGHCVSLVRCVDVCRHLCLCAVADHGHVGRTDGRMDEPHRHLMVCCAHRMAAMVECCGRVVRACSDPAMRADDPLTKRILAGGGPTPTDAELVDHLYRVFTAGRNVDRTVVQTEDKTKSDDSVVDMNDHSTFARNESRLKHSNNNNTNVLINTFMKVLPNLVVTMGGNNSVHAEHTERASELPSVRLADDDHTPEEMSRELFERLLRDIKRVEDDALECIDFARSRAERHKV